MAIDARGPRILIVEDNLDLQTLLKELLSSEYEVASVSSGEAAVKLARSFEPDVVLLDYQLPGIDGAEAGRRIKHDAEPRFVAILMLTALVDHVASSGALESGCCDAVMAKPTPLITIRAKVDELLYSHSEIT
jgi:two-component system, cell cycle response regulator